jgi:hypothetical protein
MRRTLIAAMSLYEYPVPRNSADFFRSAIQACYELPTGLHFVKAEYATIHPHWEDGLFDLGIVLVPLLAQHAPQMDTQRKWFSDMLRRKRLVPGSIESPGISISINDDYFEARYEMMLTARRRKCMHLGCTVPENIGVTTTLCSQCGVVGYCNTQVRVLLLFSFSGCESTTNPVASGLVPEIRLECRAMPPQRRLNPHRLHPGPSRPRAPHTHGFH